MKAAVFNRYGDNETVEIKDVPKPVCGPGDVIIRVHAASVNPVDWKVRSGHLKIITGRRFPKILGNECAGEVAEAGSSVKKFKQGQAVLGLPGARRLGAFAEYCRVPASAVFELRHGIPFQQAACIPITGLTALQALRDKAQISYGKKVLINGASGGVGHFAVQIAKIFGAEVTAVCSGANITFVKQLGADHVIDYSKEDFTRSIRRYNIIFDAVAKRSFHQCKQALTTHGIYVSTLPSPGVILNQYVTGHLSRKKAIAVWVRPDRADLEWLMKQIGARKIWVAIEKTYALDQAKEALAYSEAGRARGKIVLTVHP